LLVFATALIAFVITLFFLYWILSDENY